MRFPPRMAAERGLGVDTTDLLSGIDLARGARGLVELGSRQPRHYLPPAQQAVAVAPVTTHRAGSHVRRSAKPAAEGYRPERDQTRSPAGERRAAKPAARRGAGAVQHDVVRQRLDR